MGIRVALDASATSDSRRFAGIGRYAVELIAALRRLDGPVEIDVAAPRRSPLSNRWAYRYVRGQPALARLTWRTRPDVVHGLASEAAACFPLHRQVVTLHDVVPWTEHRAPVLNRTYLEFQRRLLRRVGAVIVPSESVIPEVARELAIPTTRITAIRHGISPVFSAARRHQDSALQARAGLAPEPYLLWVGTLHGPDPRKGLDVLFDAVRSLEPTERPLLGLVGKPGLGSQWAQERCLRDGIKTALPGYVDDSELAALYRGAAAVVVPSRHEGFGLPALEAMACGAPLIVTDAGSLPSVVGDAAMVVRAGDASAIAQALRALLADPGLQARLRDAGPRRTASFTWELAAKQTLAAYEHLVSATC